MNLSTTAIAVWQDWVSAVKVSNKPTVTWKLMSLADLNKLIRRNAPQKQVNCSLFSLRLQQTVAAQQLPCREGIRQALGGR